MSSFKIPSPWQSDLAIPGYVRAEGLGMRTHTTKWTPRGVYDDPDAFDPSWEKSWAVPKYVKDEGYGQGAYVTEWQPRGFYVGEVRSCEKRIKNAQRAIGDTAGNGAFGTYGRRAAAVVLGKISTLPPVAQKPALQKIMTVIDPALYSRTQQHAKEYLKAGAKPKAALELGLARAMTTGIGEEVVATGKRRGFARRGHVALALGASPGAADLATKITTTTPVSAGQCSADGQFVWVGAQGSTPGFWQRLQAGQTCSSFSSQGPTTNVTPTSGAATVPPALQLKMLKVGPFSIPLDVAEFSITWGQPLPAEWQSFIATTLAKDATAPATPGYVYGRIRDFVPNAPAKINMAFVSLESDFVYTDLQQWEKFEPQKTADQPIVVATRPDNGEEWGMYMSIRRRDVTKKWDSTTNPYVLHLQWKKKPPPGGIWNWIKRIVGEIVDFVGDVVSTVGDLACQILSSQAAYTAGAAVAASQGVPPQTGTQGVAIIQQGCQSGAPPPPQEDANSSWILPVAIGGGILLAGILLSGRKKRHP